MACYVLVSVSAVVCLNVCYWLMIHCWMLFAFSKLFLLVCCVFVVLALCEASVVMCCSLLACC